MSLPQFDQSDAIIVVDVQNDFCPGGALPVVEGDQVVPVLNQWIEAACQGGALIVATRDWHPPNHISFQERGGPWPPHCIQNSRGAEFHPDLKLPAMTLNVSKGTATDLDNYSDFETTGLAAELKKSGIRRLWVGGLAQDFCVCATVLDGLKAGFEVHLIKDATRAIDAPRGSGEDSLRKMQAAGCFIEQETTHV